MANPTSNFNWQMPTSTDLVTDLPADFEVFGQAVDTSLADLKGGTTGQILTKASGTDMDFTWSAPAGGKIKQVVSATYSTATTTTSTSFVTTNLAASITPTSATSKILVLTQSEVEKGRGTTNGDSDVLVSAIYRGGSAVWTGSSSLRLRVPVTTNSSPNVLIDTVQSLVYLDSPSTTSATTYTVYFKIDSQGNATYHNNNSTSSIILLEVDA